MHTSHSFYCTVLVNKLYNLKIKNRMITDLTNTLKRIYLLDYELPVLTYNDTNIVFTLNCCNFSGSSLMSFDDDCPWHKFC